MIAQEAASLESGAPDSNRG